MAVMLLLTAAADTHAQVHEISVRDGRVVVDGRPLAPETLPETLDLRDTEARFILSGDAAAFLTISGRLYRFTHEGVQEVHGRESFAPVEVRVRGELDPIPVRVAAGAPPAAGAQPEVVMIVEQAEVLRERARELQRLSLELQQTRSQSHELFDMIESIQQSAAETEHVARSLPHLQTQRYMQELRERNTELYGRLIREQGLERETVDLSQRIRALEEGPQRNQLVDRLRSRLEEIFEMKQENRRREITELEERLNSLQRRLEKRERYHDYIIEKRLNELIGNEDK